MIKKIDFEAHHSTDKWVAARIGAVGAERPLTGGAADASDPFMERIQIMDKYNVRTAFVSIGGGLEGFPLDTAVDVSRSANDELYALSRKHSGRIRGYANLVPQSVEISMSELIRCHDELGFIAWNTHSNFTDTHIDDDEYFPLLEKAAQLGMFVYLHPGPSSYERLNGFGQVLNAGLGYHVDVAITLTRLILKGVFDRLPELKLILGHYGETLPFILDRMDSFISQNQAKNVPDSVCRNRSVNEHKLDYYFKRNIYVTTSGNYSSAAFNCTKERLGIDHMLFGTDYPIESYEQTVEFLESVGMTQVEKEMLYYKNAEEIFGIKE
ncbi:MAG: amidohydrolase family protein [Oscillospiraceae bacterium]|jgi:predicted TIM-barrel fold metal-dependent hydrolase